MTTAYIAARSPPIRLGIIGMGYAGFQHLAAATAVPGFQVLAVAEPAQIDSARIDPGIARHHDWRALVADARLDAVSICSPHFLHAPMVEASLKAGKHVLLEKPLAATIDDARHVAALAGESGRVVLVEMTHRFYPPLLAARELVRSGRLGQVVAVEDRVMESITARIAAWLTHRASAGGGVALTNGIHMLDRVAWLLGQPLTFHGGLAGWAQGLGDVEDTAAMQLSLPNGTPVNLLASWVKRNDGITDDELTVYGTGGTLRVWAWRGWSFEPAGHPPEVHELYPADAGPIARARVGITGAMACFALAVRRQTTDYPDPRQILASQEIVEQFYQATCRRTFPQKGATP